MYPNTTKFLLSHEISISYITFEPAVLKEWPTGWQIEYRVINPQTSLLEKKRIRFEKIRKRLGDVKARKHAKLYCDAINKKLEEGWNPYLEGKNVKAFHKLTEALSKLLSEKELDLKNKVFRPDSMRVYKSHISMLNEWLHLKKISEIHIGSFTKDHASEYLDYVYVRKEVSTRTWNNYLKYMRGFWNWFIDKNYCSENPFTKIKPKPEQEKQRVVIPPEWSSKIVEYCRNHNPALELVCGLVYNSFMRPAEICRTQIKDIHLNKSAIYLPANKSKTNTSRWCLLPPHLVEMISKQIENVNPDDYLITQGLLPGKIPICTRRLDKHWERMRKKISLPKEMQLYSYRDTGITDLKIKGHSNLFISSITGHKNSEEIETYTHEPDMTALQYVMKESTKLGF